MPATARRNGRADPASVDPELVGRGDVDRGRHAATRPTTTGSSTGFRTATTPQEQLRHLYALAEFDDAELMPRTCELAMSGEVKTQNAPFLLRRASPTATTAARRGTSCASTGPRPTSSVPPQHDRAHDRAGKLLDNRPIVADVQSFFAEHPIPQAAKTLDQILERQLVNSAVREHHAASLADSLRSR